MTAEVTREEMIAAVRLALDYVPPWREGQAECLRAVLRELEAGGWRPISEAPKDGTEVLIGWFELPGQRSMAVAGWHSTHRAWCNTYTLFTSDEGNQPTHFMPLPSPPSTSDGGK